MHLHLIQVFTSHTGIYTSYRYSQFILVFTAHTGIHSTYRYSYLIQVFTAFTDIYTSYRYSHLIQVLTPHTGFHRSYRYSHLIRGFVILRYTNLLLRSTLSYRYSHLIQVFRLHWWDVLSWTLIWFLPMNTVTYFSDAWTKNQYCILFITTNVLLSQ